MESGRRLLPKGTMTRQLQLLVQMGLRSTCQFGIWHPWKDIKLIVMQLVTVNIRGLPRYKRIEQM